MNSSFQADKRSAAASAAIEGDDDKRRKQRLSWMIRIAMAVALLVVFAYLARSLKTELPKLRQAKPLGVLLMVLVFIPTRLLTAEIMRIGLKALGHRISIYESFLVSMVNAYANLLIPRAGLGLPAVYMKAKHKVPIADFSTVQLLPMTVLQITTIGIAGVICLVVLHFFYGTSWQAPLMLLFGGVAVGSFAATHVPIGIPEHWNNKISTFIRRLTESWRSLSRSGHTISQSMLLHACILVLRGVRMQLAFWALGVHVNYLGVCVGSLLADLAFFISLTPSALGFREGGIALGAALMGTTPEIAVLTTLLDRVVYSVVIIVIGQFGLIALVRPVFRNDMGEVLKAAKPLPGMPATPEVD